MWTPELVGLGFLIFLILVFLEVPVVFALGFGSIVILLIQGSFPLDFVAQRMIVGLNSFPLLAVPLFIFVGQCMNKSEVTDHLFTFAKCLIGGVRGNLAHVNVLSSIIFAGMSGSAVADTAGLGLVEMKAMLAEGYDVDFSAAVTAASSTIGPIIPPSVPLVVYGFMAETSIGRLFLGGILPGLLMGISIMILVYFISIKRKFPKGESYSINEKFHSFIIALPDLFTPVLLLGGIVLGIFTPTEAAGVAALYTLFLGFIVYRNLNNKDLFEILKYTAKSSGIILLVLAFASIFTYLISIAQIPKIITDTLLGITQNKYIILIMINLVLLLAGCIMESLAILAIGVPILIPIINALGINLVHFGVMMVLNLMIGLITPPVGLCLYVVADIGKISVGKVIRAVWPFLIPLIITLLLVTYIPEITLFIPNLIMGK
jgi:tripartite ATP-independent transporter DctM subunit